MRIDVTKDSLKTLTRLLKLESFEQWDTVEELAALLLEVGINEAVGMAFEECKPIGYWRKYKEHDAKHFFEEGLPVDPICGIKLLVTPDDRDSYQCRDCQNQINKKAIKKRGL